MFFHLASCGAHVIPTSSKVQSVCMHVKWSIRCTSTLALRLALSSLSCASHTYFFLRAPLYLPLPLALLLQSLFFLLLLPLLIVLQPLMLLLRLLLPSLLLCYCYCYFYCSYRCLPHRHTSSSTSVAWLPCIQAGSHVFFTNQAVLQHRNPPRSSFVPHTAPFGYQGNSFAPHRASFGPHIGPFRSQNSPSQVQHRVWCGNPAQHALGKDDKTKLSP